MEEKKEVNDLKKHFTKLHEKIQNKYDEMQKRLEKSKSVDALATIDDDYNYKEQSYSSNDNIRESHNFDRLEIDRNTLTRTVIVEEVTTRNARFKDVHREESVFESMHDFMNIEREEIERENNEYNKQFNYSCESLYEICGDSDSCSIPTTPRPKLSIRDRISSKLCPARREKRKSSEQVEIGHQNEYNKQCNYSLESLNEVGGDSDGLSISIPSTPTPKLSIRDRISSKITARRERRKAEKENALKDNKKKETREKVEKFILSNTTKQDLLKGFKKSKVATLTIALIEASDLGTDVSEEKPCFMVCRFRLGTEKYKSKLIKSHTPVVKWQELFNFNMYDENMLEITLWEKDVFIGRASIDLQELEKEKTHRMRLDLECETGNAQVFILLTITGTALNTLVDLDDYQESQRRLSTVRKKLAWFHIKNNARDVGWCSIIVYGAKGLSGNECYCIVELGNDRLQTHTDSKTNDPNWMKIFTFTVNDITSILEVTVHDEKKSEDVGKLSVPLLNIKNGEKQWYALKDSTQRDRAKGNNPKILLEMNVSWNALRASMRVINPKEEKYLEMDDKLQRYIFARNLSRAKAVFSWIMDAFRIVKTCFEWESRKLNVIALTIWLLFCWFFKMWMVPLLLLIPFLRYRPEKYYVIHWWKYFNKKASMELEELSKKDKEEKNTSLRQKINSLQEMVQTVQNFIGKFASLGESIKNLFNFTVPFLSFLAIIMITAVALVMYLVPVQYIFMIWGIRKFARKILRPNRIPNDEILDLLSRVPDDETLLNIQELPLEEVPEEDLIK